MSESIIKLSDSHGKTKTIPVNWHHTVVIGSGAAGLNAAVQLHCNGIEDIVVLTEGLEMGTSINTGSDKQTYYKLSMCGADTDSPATMAETYFAGGSMHGDLALVEASLSARSFINLVNLGVPFPRDAYGQFVGYKTDHDPRQRATSIGPYTSREMCRALIRQVERLGIEVLEGRNVVRLLTIADGDALRAAGAVALCGDSELEVYGAANVVLAVGGPGGLYKTSVYPNVHTGAIGLGLQVGAKAQSLPESQYGMASTKFRWNVSGTYMQVIPRFISTDADGKGDEQEFLREYFDSVGDMNSQVFLKGYQWPFDSRKVVGGSSIVDILVYIETVVKGRRVFLDFRSNPDDFTFDELSDESREYLTKSGALLDTPIERLKTMNPGAIELYADNDIDLTCEPLEIAVCAQHNNGGLAGDHWWESTNIKHLFPVGEVNGSHGVYRPGGSALNSGQVGAFRAAELISNKYRENDINKDKVIACATAAADAVLVWLEKCSIASKTWQEERSEFQERMTRAGAHIRSKSALDRAVVEAWDQYRRIDTDGCRSDDGDLTESIRNRQLCFAHAVYLESILFAVGSGVGSRGSAIVLDEAGTRVHGKLDDSWAIVLEDDSFKSKVLETEVAEDGTISNCWVARRDMPEVDAWFETAWAKFRNGEIYE